MCREWEEASCEIYEQISLIFLSSKLTEAMIKNKYNIVIKYNILRINQ